MSPRVRGIVLKAAGLAAIYLTILVLSQVGIVDDYAQVTIVTICINIILAVSLNLITGFTGQFSLGHAGFMAIGAYTCGMITVYNPELPFFLLGVLAGAILAAVVGLLVGIPTLRLRGDYLAIATLGMAEIIRVLLLNFEFVNGAAGLNGLPQFVDWNWLFLFTAGTVLLIGNFLRSRQGRDCIAIREDEIAAVSIGVNDVRAKTMAFVVGAFFGGVAGALYASYFYFITPNQFGFLKSVDILVIVVLGGLGSLSGSVIAAILLALVSAWLQQFPEIRMILYSVVLVLIMVFRPQGLMGDRELSLSLLSRFLPKRKEAGA